MSRVRLSIRDRWAVAWGSLFLQAAFNTERRQAIGFAAALSPLVRLFPANRRAEFLTRQLEEVNTNPAMAGPLLGGVARLEEDAAAGDMSAVPRIRKLKRALEGPLAAAGDTLLWLGVRPAAGYLGGAVALIAGAWGPVLFLVVFNAVHLSLRMGGVFWGYAHPGELGSLLRRPALRSGVRLAPSLAWVTALILAAGVLIRSGGAPGVVPAGVVGLGLGWIAGRIGIRHGGFLRVGAIILGLVLTLTLGARSP